MTDLASLPYRIGVGLCVFNKKGLVLCAERRDTKGAWQMPQGGVQKGEEPQLSALRELREEIGTDHVRLIGKVPEVLQYEFPDYVHFNGGVFNGKYRGQKQTWFAALFLGEDSEIDLSGEEDPEPAEFVAWEWLPLEEVIERIVDFKRPMYERIMEVFTPLSEALSAGKEVPSL